MLKNWVARSLLFCITALTFSCKTEQIKTVEIKNTPHITSVLPAIYMKTETNEETNRDECALVLTKQNTLTFVNIASNQTISGDMTFNKQLAISDRFFIFENNKKNIIGHFYFVKQVTGFMGFGQKYGIFSCEVHIDKNKQAITQIIQATEPIYTHNTPIQKLFTHENGGFLSSSNVSYKYFNPELDQSDNVETYSKKIRSEASLGQKMDRFFNFSSDFTYHGHESKNILMDGLFDYKPLPKYSGIIKSYINKETFVFCKNGSKKECWYNTGGREHKLPLNDTKTNKVTEIDLTEIDLQGIDKAVDIIMKNSRENTTTMHKCFNVAPTYTFSLNIDNQLKLLPVRHVVVKGKLYFPVFHEKEKKIVILKQHKNSEKQAETHTEIDLNEFIRNSDVDFQLAVRTPTSVLLLLYINKAQTENHNLLLSVPVSLLKPKTE